MMRRSTSPVFAGASPRGAPDRASPNRTGSWPGGRLLLDPRRQGDLGQGQAGDKWLGFSEESLHALPATPASQTHRPHRRAKNGRSVHG
jgi:hypothetical protein